MMQYESGHIEYKSRLIDNIYKEVAAFANPDGGVFCIGIDDHQGNQDNVTGIKRADATRLTNSIRYAIQ